MFKRATRLAAIVMAIAAAGCSGSDGAQGPQGPQGNQGNQGPAGQDLTATAKPETCTVCHGSQGTSHQAIYNAGHDASKLTASISAVDVDGATSVLTVHLTANYNGGPATLADLNSFAKKGFYAVTYNPGTRAFDGSNVATFNNRFLADGAVDGAFITTATAGRAVPNMVVGWFANGVLNYEGNLYDNYANFIWKDGTVNYQSQATATGCARCHGQPFLKGGYRAADQAFVAGADADFLLCKGCHYDTRAGHDADWQRMVDAPVDFVTTGISAAQNALYAYKASVMNDVHMAHAMEFAYPMSMSNCATCHTTQAQRDAVLATTNFTLATCRSCHPVTGPAAADAQANRAPALIGLMTNPALTYVHASQVANDTVTGKSKLYANSASQPTCTGCHDGTGEAPTFATIHNGGFNKVVATAAGARRADTTKLSVTGATYDQTTRVVTVNFSATGAPANAIIKPTVVASLYGKDTKDFAVSGHSSQFTDGTPNLEWSEGATVRGSNPPVSANTSRLTVTPAAAAQGVTSWVATINLTTWAAMIDSGLVKQIEVGLLPTMALDPTHVVSADNEAVAIGGTTQTINVTATAADARPTAPVYGKTIVTADKCNACHDALGTTFHSPNYGSAGVVGCRLCHFPGSGASHLELQSRSIDSYVHAIHEFQNLDTNKVDFTNPLQAWRYDHHVKSGFPAQLTNCEACHTAGTYNPPANDRSLPGIISPVATTTSGAPIPFRGTTDFRKAGDASANVQIPSTIGAVPRYVTGPGARACGGCHRGYPVNSNNGAGLMGFIDHGGAMGYALPAASSAEATTIFDRAVQAVMAFFQ